MILSVKLAIPQSLVRALEDSGDSQPLDPALFLLAPGMGIRRRASVLEQQSQCCCVFPHLGASKALYACTSSSLQMMGTEQIAFLEILTFIAGALLLVGLGSLVSTLLQPNRPNEAKLYTYESGETPIGSSWGRFNARFYVIAIIFTLFEVETVLLFPWAMVWANPTLNEATEGLWARYTAMSAVLFIVFLGVGLAYMWRQGHFTSIQSAPLPSSFSSKVPRAHYEQINHRYASTLTETTTHLRS